MCMIKIFWGAGVVTPSKPPPPYEQLFHLPTPYFKMFLKDPLMTPTPTTPLQASFTATPPTTPSPPKNFDHTPCAHQLLIAQHITEINDVSKYKYRYLFL